MRLGDLGVAYRAGQRDYRFNEAEAHAPRIPRASDRLPGEPKDASMRPRRMRLGYDYLPTPNMASIVASMRPRRMRLGYSR